MEKELSPLDAWHDFYAWARLQPFWGNLEEVEKARMYERNASAKGQRRYPLRAETIRRILTRYAPERYEFRERVILKD